MTDVDDDHKQFTSANQVHDPVAADPVRVAALQRAYQGFTLKRIAFKIVQRVRDPLIESRFPLDHTADDTRGLIGECDFISGQRRL